MPLERYHYISKFSAISTYFYNSETDLNNETLFQTQFIMAVFQSGIHLKIRPNMRPGFSKRFLLFCQVVIFPLLYSQRGDTICVRLLSHIHTQGHVYTRSWEVHSVALYYFFSDNLTIKVVQVTNLDQTSNFREIKLQEINLTFHIYFQSIAICSNRLTNFALWAIQAITVFSIPTVSCLKLKVTLGLY